MEDKNTIKLGEKTFSSSKYQYKIFEEIEQGCGNMVITAAAGSAKTSTIENCLRFIPKNKKSIFLAFNVSTVEKLRGEITDQSNVKIVTFHGLGNRILREHDLIKKDTIIDEFKYIRYIKENIDNISMYKEHISLNNMYYVYLNNILDLINYSRYYLAMSIKGIERVAKIYGIVPVRDEYNVVRDTLIWGKNNTNVIDNTDMIWLPNVMNLETKIYRYDFIFIDEAQDTTIAHQKLVDKTFKRGARFIAVGDLIQQINVWCGATEQAINNYLKRDNTKQMSLPISYRCPTSIIDVAKKYSPEIEAMDGAPKGEIRYDVSLNDAQSGDMVLCRVISKLVEAYLTLLRNNKKAFLKGNDAVKDTYLALINSVNAKFIDSRCITSNGLIPQLYKMYFDMKYNYMNTLNLPEEDVIYRSDLINLYDNIEALKVLSEGITTVDELTEKVKIIFNGDDKDAIILSTVHKAKGLEADNIFILAPSLMDNKLAKQDWEITAEKNLNYVAITRAKKSLNYIKEDKKGFFNNFWSSKNMKNDLITIEHKINYQKEEETDKAENKKELGVTKFVSQKENSKFKLCNLGKK